MAEAPKGSGRLLAAGSLVLGIVALSYWPALLWEKWPTDKNGVLLFLAALIAATLMSIGFGYCGLRRSTSRACRILAEVGMGLGILSVVLLFYLLLTLRVAT